MASMITNALVTTKTNLTNGGLYQHIFQEEFFFVIRQIQYHHLVHLSNHLDGQYLILQMFVLPIWYLAIATWFVLEEMYKMSYGKLQYPNYIKYINPNVHMIRIFKKDILNLMVKLWNLTSSTYLASLLKMLSKIASYNWMRILYKIIQVACLEN
jgi:hypothetical protein